MSVHWPPLICGRARFLRKVHVGSSSFERSAATSLIGMASTKKEREVAPKLELTKKLERPHFEEQCHTHTC